tara:strand:- start:50074 stop:50202 length:129 start_codon:yes stop_codon:yes gene_type:complete
MVYQIGFGKIYLETGFLAILTFHDKFKIDAIILSAAQRVLCD